MMGMPKAMVLPVPVGALAMTSLPAIMGGMQPACTGVETVYPLLRMARSVASDRPKLSNATPWVISIAFFLVFLKNFNHFYYNIPVKLVPMPRSGRPRLYPRGHFSSGCPAPCNSSAACCHG